MSGLFGRSSERMFTACSQPFHIWFTSGSQPVFTACSQLFQESVTPDSFA